MCSVRLSLAILSLVVCAVTALRYESTWESLDSRPLPQWYDDAKVGIMIHWGVYSVPSYGSGNTAAWFWYHWKVNKSPKFVQYMRKNYKPGFTYQEFASDFTARYFDAAEWVDLFERSGAKYVVLTGKHHDGYTLWPSRYSFGWNAVDVGPHRDVLGELADAIRENGKLKFGVFYSLFEWFNPLYIDDKNNAFQWRNFVDKKMVPELKELVNTYRPDLFYANDWMSPIEYWRTKELIAWLYNESPVKDTIVTNDIWGKGVECLHGDFRSCSNFAKTGVLDRHKWEHMEKLDKLSWAHRTNARVEDFISTDELIAKIVSTVSCGGNILVNVGPTKEGTIEPIFAERLVEMGRWLKVNGEAIYETRPWLYQNDTSTGSVWYTTPSENSLSVYESSPMKLTKRTSVGTTVYAIVLDYPYATNSVNLGVFSNDVWKIVQITMLGYPTALEWKPSSEGIVVEFPVKNEIDQLKLRHGWTLKITLSS
ncbi:putative alpha-L-fucosidase [Anopheles ziemanni]|uniref:putative alpha-L-fucosidase n=1 Tax=Anopheles coustani TaxID=139045 RepID=UPI00265808A6|nr:putative alpha-L-fucosidase [Anopheles coustani]XP_058178310.1 putative alpha-L-fucosidase [Anopheles ziemanni]